MRALRLFGYVLLTLLCARAAAHDHPGSPAENPLGCDPSAGEVCFRATIDDFHTPDSHHPNARGESYFALNRERTELRYLIAIDGLQLKEDAGDRTEASDIVGIHLHLFVPDTVGPHVLNIFGLATFGMPAEDDSDLVVDYHHLTLTGIYDDGDAAIDPSTGQPYLPFFPLPSKPLTNWLDALFRGDLMVAVHTNATGFPQMAIHGHITRIVPEPSGLFVVSLAAGWIASRSRRVLRISIGRKQVP